MIAKHKSIILPLKVMNATNNYLIKHRELDGVIEVFNNSKNQGYVLKIFHAYDKKRDKCIWAYEDFKNDELNIVVGNHDDCDEYNNFSSNALLLKTYPVKWDVAHTSAQDISNYIYKEYNKNFKI